MFTLIPKQQKKLVIKASDIRVSLGHQERPCGIGIHQDKRKRRQKTRNAQLRKALND